MTLIFTFKQSISHIVQADNPRIHTSCTHANAPRQLAAGNNVQNVARATKCVTHTVVTTYASPVIFLPVVGARIATVSRGLNTLGWS